MSDDQMTYMLTGDRAPRRGPAHLQHRTAFKVQGGRVIPDPIPVKLQPVEAVAEEVKEEEQQPEAPRRGRPRKSEADADQA